MVKTGQTLFYERTETTNPNSIFDPNFLIFSRTRSRRSAEPERLIFPRKIQPPPTTILMDSNGSKLPISCSKQDTAGHSLPLTTSYLWEKNFSGSLFAVVTFSQLNKAITPMGKNLGNPDAFFFKTVQCLPEKIRTRKGMGKNL
ncbi:hypothetical protein AVEN_174167-1 [Araneus ventricosus]|uniref:Uncharacterized protein n=1 Tax=Araneus ventricosus TaxID=182803 RepID=A0A4Y2WJ27_ARAVE|nr:hypothetical protein AVEN_224333-1 [Araneus ventricosus]GBO37486.1 hypothetical protein AVEN_257554-1 [Araneus ventricosus]GBO37487.1 hypothetical protein AVEN_88023-1 [Araneus ventricosus]GBO37488.1 hypothetical protein AVEN_174167-1 [Araneus ventricosus]